MNSVGRYANGRAIYMCDACGKAGPWEDSWGYYGSLRDEENGTIRAVWCSPECCERLRAEGINQPRWRDRLERAHARHPNLARLA